MKIGNSRSDVIYGPLVALLMLFASCSDWDEYRKYTKDGEIIYPGKIDYVEIFPGDNRVRVIGAMGPDPRVTSMRIYWNDYQDSITLSVDEEIIANGFDELINVNEGLKTFTFHTYDEFGNQSLPFNELGVAYGDVFRTKVKNRKVSSIHSTDSSTMIIWEPIDTSTGAKYVEVSFKVDDFDEAQQTSISSDTTELVGVLSDSIIYFQTIYVPTPDCIDQFYSESSSYNIER